MRTALYAWLAQRFGGFAAAACHFDCDFYLRIATDGYTADTGFHGRGALPNWAYFPLFPLLVRAIWQLTSLPPAVAGLAVAAAAFAGFAAFGALYIARTRPSPDPILWLALVCAAPFGFYFSLPYTEAPFAALATACLWARSSGRPLAAAGFASLAAACRPTGLLLSMILLADQARRIWQTRRQPRSAATWTDLLLPAAIAPLGLSAYMAWQYAQIGDGLAFSHVQLIWDRRWLGPLTWIRLGLRQQDWGNVAALFPAQSYAFSAACACAGLAAATWLATRRRFAEAWIAAAAILLPLASGLHSMPRFAGANPALLLAAYDLLRLAGAKTRIAALLLLAGGQAVLLVAWYSHADGLF